MRDMSKGQLAAIIATKKGQERARAEATYCRAKSMQKFVATAEWLKETDPEIFKKVVEGELDIFDAKRIVNIPDLRKRFLKGGMKAIIRKESWVYFIKAENGLIKIGTTTHLKERLKQLQRMSPVKLELIIAIEGGVDKEQALHQRFEKCRSHGEWFFPSEELLSYIKELEKD